MNTKNNFSHISPVIFLIILFFASMTYVHAEASPQSPLNPQELNAVIQEIKAMVKTNEELVETFVVHEATPERIDRIYQMPEFIQQDKVVRENGLIFAGQGSLLSFDKPSDIISKMVTWFPQEVAAAKTAGDDRFFGHVNLFGPYPSWKNEQAAFLVLWECMPQNAWLNPTQNPFKLNHYGDFMAIADESSGIFNFDACVHERSGKRIAWHFGGEDEEVRIYKKLSLQYKKEALEIGNRVAPVLQRKFASFLSSNRCKGTGPDDCVLILKLWSSLTPADAELAKMIQSLEIDVTNSGTLPPSNLKEAFPERVAGYENVLRIAEFLRIKQSSIENAPDVWPQQAFQTAFTQMSDMLQRYQGVGFNVGKTPQAREAFFAGLEMLYKKSSCDVIDSMLIRKPALRTTFALRHILEPNPNCFINPGWDWEWLEKGESIEAIELRNRYIALLGHQESGAVHEMILDNLTKHGDSCLSRDDLWLKELCHQWISEPQSVALELDNTQLSLNKTGKFNATPLQLPPQVAPTMEAWLSSLVKDMSAADQAKMQALITEINPGKGSIASATWWKKAHQDISVLALHLYLNVNSRPYSGLGILPYDGSHILLIFNKKSFNIAGVPGRFIGEYDHREVVNVSDIDNDGNVEVWFAEAFRTCKGDETDLQRELDCTAKTAEMGEVWGSTLSFFVKTPNPPKNSNAHKNKTPSYDVVLTKYAQAKSQYDYNKQACNIRLIGTVLKNKLDINFGEGGNSGERGDLISLVCKQHPLYPERTIVALFHELKDKPVEPSEEKKGFALAVIDIKKNKVINLYRDIIEEDATTRVFGAGLTIDTARYNLAPGQRAFGVRMGIGYSPRCAEGGENDYLTLFVEEKTQLKPVLKNFAMNSWQITEGSNGCGYGTEDFTTDNVNLVLGVAKSSTNGWHDLEVTERHETERMSGSAEETVPDKKSYSKLLGKLRMNGKEYSGKLK
jgi:hypothetical protein